MSNLVFDTILSDFFPRVYRRPWVVQQACDTENFGSNFPNLRTNENEYTFEVDVPGIEKDDLVMELKNDILTIHSKPYEVEKDEKSQKKRIYRFQFKVPDDINSDQLKATLKNGVLTVTLPKSEEKKPIKVPVIIE